MVGVTPDDGGKRRLPPWMVVVAAKSNEDVDTVNNCQKEALACDSKPKGISRSRKTIIKPCEEENASHVPQNCETKRRKRRISSRNDDNVPDTVPSERKVSVTDDHRRKKKPWNEIAAEELEDLELTAEDLLSIAKEYVNADKETRDLRLPNEERKSEKQLPSYSSKDKSTDVGRSIPIVTTCETAPNETTNLTSEQPLPTISRTGDPAQDMLDVFFGSLLKKPVEKTSFTAKMAFDHEIRTLSQSTVAGKEETVLQVTKKKSSLRDKVAMLLD